MSAAGFDVFDRTLQATHAWLDDIMEELMLEQRQQAYELLRGVLHTVRDRLPLVQVVRLGAQLPILLRGIYYEGWSPTLTGGQQHIEDFLARISLEVDPPLKVSVEAAVQCVLRVIAERVDAGEIRQVIHTMAREMRGLRPEQAAAPGDGQRTGSCTLAW